MNDPKEIPAEMRNRLKAMNPFTSSSVSDPWEYHYPDIDSINGAASEGIYHLIGQKSDSPRLPCAGLIFGETGSGKTHLIRRILKRGTASARPFPLAYIQPIEDPGQTYRYLLREVIVNLCYPAGSGGETTQLDRIVGKLIQEVERLEAERRDAERGEVGYGGLTSHVGGHYGEQRLVHRSAMPSDSKMSDFRACLSRVMHPKELSPYVIIDMFRLAALFFEALIRGGGIEKEVAANAGPTPEPAPESRPQPKPDALGRLVVRFPDIPKSFFAVLIQYRHPDRRGAVIEWLKGASIDDLDTQLLGVEKRDEETIARKEQHARQILESLGTLMAYYGEPLVICFDRLENYDTDEKIRSLGAMVEFLVDRGKGMLPLVFVRGEQWEEILRKKLNQQILTRLETNQFQLKGCTAEQALQIVRSRLDVVLGDHGMGDLFPFDRATLEAELNDGLISPRRVIMAANRQLRDILYPDQAAQTTPKAPESIYLDRLRDAFEGQLQKVRNDFDRHSPDRARLRRALELFLSHFPDEATVRAENCKTPEDKYIDFQCEVVAGETRYPALFIIDNETNHSSVRASLKRGVDFLDETPGAKAIYIRDGRCDFPAPPNWKATNEMRLSFDELGGKTIFLDADQAARWYALTQMIYDIKSGDITLLDGENVHRSVLEQELAAYIRAEVHSEKYTAFRAIADILAGLDTAVAEAGNGDSR